ncbi:MAG TPA: TolC family protein [Bryobacteraceae bacterium]|jgi:outer membrane protein TolC
MNRAAAALLVFSFTPDFAGSLPVPQWLSKRFHPQTVELRDVEGLADHVANGKLELTLKTFLELVLKNSTDVNLARMDVYTAQDQIGAAEAPFDPTLGFGFNTFRSVTPQSTQIGGAATLSTLNQNSFINYQENLYTGQTVNVGFSAARSSTNSAFSFFNPNILGTLNFSVAQPLLQGRTNIARLGPLQAARSQLLIVSSQTEARISDTLAAAAGQYWDAVRARDIIAVEKQTLDLAQSSYDRDRKALDLGALADLDIYQSETQVAERNRDLIQAQYAYKSALDGLRRLIGADLTPEMRDTALVLEDDPSMLPSKTGILPFEEALAAALKARPEMNAADRRVEVDDLNARIARNLLQPRLDLTAQGVTSGLGGNQVAVVGPLGITTPAVPGGFTDAFGQVLGFSYPSYGGGIQMSFPLHSKAAQAQLADALVNKTRDRYAARQVQQQITLDVRQAINSLDLANASIEAAKRARDLAQKNVEAEQQKYELGSITAFEVLDSQTRLASSESALLNAYVGYQEAYASYQRSTSTLLDGLGIVLENSTRQAKGASPAGR